MAVAVFAAGCFWGVEETFRQLEGVTGTAVGYTGGHRADPNYKEVCRGDTGHSEAVRVEFDPERITYDQLLEVFWACHDPTQLNRQGPDVGDQYRSAIYPQDAGQEALAKASLAREEASGHHRRPIATALEPTAPFWMAEDYHQQYVAKQKAKYGTAPSCH
ncbi:MAG: peptide-methionine (S)-S-oxide reductase MsrA [Rhodospirillum sp.]|nr:peptide-methionine (S)-S-oxide reductase MsrA [Rhodospirillum sp.]MCF8489747.1 peptide-methionine (S)-S-oxide reductase MsrA [Rhodospirillum sp.]